MTGRLAALLLLGGLAACDGRDRSAPDPGATRFRSVCQDCHGADGEGRGTYPRLAGRPADELAARLRQYRTGHKTGSMTDTMRPFALLLTEQEIDQIAAWLSSR